jgi:lipopolysaccharide export system protein LptC
MYGRPATWFLLLLLALLAALTMWADVAVQPPAPKQDGSSRHDPDYILHNFNTLKTDLQGNAQYMLAAVEMKHFPDDDTTHLTRPRFTQYATGKPYTQIESQRGLVTSDGEQVYMMDKVKVVRAATRLRGEMTVLTEFLHITPDTEVARTDRPVTILQAPKSVARAQGGMVYDKKNGTLTLTKRVRVHYERPAIKAVPGKAQARKTPAAKAVPAKKATSGNTKNRTRRP